jgi:hypothetical protein
MSAPGGQRFGKLAKQVHARAVMASPPFALITLARTSTWELRVMETGRRSCPVRSMRRRAVCQYPMSYKSRAAIQVEHFAGEVLVGECELDGMRSLTGIADTARRE